MKDITFRNTAQEEKRQNSMKMFYRLREAPARRAGYPGATLRHLAIHRFRQSDMLGLMSAPVPALEQTHAQLRAAIVHRRPIAALYRGRRRLLCPHLLGWNRHRQLHVLCYQYGGDSESGLLPPGASDNWRCLVVENLSQVELLDGPWQTAQNHSRIQTCIQDIELDVDDYPQPLPPASPTKSAKP